MYSFYPLIIYVETFFVLRDAYHYIKNKEWARALQHMPHTYPLTLNYIRTRIKYRTTTTSTKLITKGQVLSKKTYP